MSKQAIIGINGSLLPFSETVDKLRTPGIGGSDITWVPEDQTRCESLHVTANGTYPAASAGKYGYNYVTVSVAGASVTGKDGDGDEATATPDPETGIIEYTKIPSRIEITTPPTKLVYADGQTIDITGAVIKAYLETGGEYGVVPNGEITLNPNKAVYDESTDTPAQYESDLDTGAFVQPIPAAHYVKFTANNGTTVELSGPVMTCTRINGKFKVYYASDSSPFTYHYKITDSHGNVTESDDSVNGSKYTADSMDVYYVGDPSIANYASLDGPVIDMQAEPTAAEKGAAMWTLVHGQMVKPAGSPQTITVSWPRPGDGAVLETSFNITVTPASQEG